MYALRDKSGKLVARAKNKASAYRTARRARYFRSSVNAVKSDPDFWWGELAETSDVGHGSDLLDHEVPTGAPIVLRYVAKNRRGVRPGYYVAVKRDGWTEKIAGPFKSAELAVRNWQKPKRDWNHAGDLPYEHVIYSPSNVREMNRAGGGLSFRITKTVYRGQSGFLVSGRGRGTFRTRIFTQSRERAEAIRNALRRDDHDEVSRILLSEARESDVNRAGATKQMTVVLAAVGNPDFGEPHDIGVPRTVVPVDSYAAASNAVLGYIARNGLGGGNWAGGQIFRGGKMIAHVSYNGRVWRGKGWKRGQEPIYEPKATASGAG